MEEWNKLNPGDGVQENNKKIADDLQEQELAATKKELHRLKQDMGNMAKGGMAPVRGTTPQ